MMLNEKMCNGVTLSAVRQGAVEGSRKNVILEGAKRLTGSRVALFATVLFLSASSAFAWPWSNSGEKKDPFAEGRFA